MASPLYAALNQELAPLNGPIAELLHVDAQQAVHAQRAITALTLASLRRSEQQRGATGTLELLDASMLQNIPADAPLNRELIWVARDTGRPLLDKFFIEGEQRQQMFAQLSAQLGTDAVQTQDLVQTYLTFIIRALSIWSTRQGIDAVALQQHLLQEGLDDPSIPAWVIQHDQVQRQHAVQAGDLDPVAVSKPTTPMAPPDLGGVTNAGPTAHVAAETRQEQQTKGLLSQYGLHLAFALLVLIPLLVFFKSCTGTKQEGVERMNNQRASIDTGMNGEGKSVLPNTRNTDNPGALTTPTNPAATEVVPHNGAPATTQLPTTTAEQPALPSDPNGTNASAAPSANQAQSAPVVIPGNTAADSDPNVATARAQ